MEVAEAGLLNKSSYLTPALVVSKSLLSQILFGSHFVMLLKSGLDVQQTHQTFCWKFSKTAKAKWPNMANWQNVCQLSLRLFFYLIIKFERFFDLNLFVMAKLCTILSRSWMKSFVLHKYCSYLVLREKKFQSSKNTFLLY